MEKLCLKGADGMTNSVDPDQTAPLGAVWTGSALYAQTYHYYGYPYYLTLIVTHQVSLYTCSGIHPLSVVINHF